MRNGEKSLRINRFPNFQIEKSCRLMKKMNVCSVLFFMCIVHTLIYAQSSSISQAEQELHNLTDKKTTLSQQTFMETAASTWFDVTYYHLELDVITQPNYLKGKVTITGICRIDSTRNLTLDLVNQMHIDSVLENGQAIHFTQNSSSFDLTLARVYKAGEILSVDVYYGGTPIATGFGSFVFDTHSGIPWIHSLSEPYAAKDWWPCKDDPSDKADSADIIVTCDSAFKVGSEGKLISIVNNGNGTSTHYWRERYPIASYLISVAITNYNQFSDWFRYSDTDSMEVLNYVLPEHTSDALQKLPRVIDMLRIYSDLFGRYPFIQEKYGHAEISGGAAMEHQTMTSTPSFEEDVISHELAHQWFGDMITCRSWSELWLNEGFAQYCSALYRERMYGSDSYWAYMNLQFNLARSATGAIGVPDTTSVLNLFNAARLYSKGAFVLHMLRHVLGDSIFFHCLYAYANNSTLKYSTATIKDFQSVCETVSGKDLNYFFQEWIYGEGYPAYTYSWKWKSLGDSSMILLVIEQPSGQSQPAFYTMPIDIRITENGRDTMLTVYNNAISQSFMIKSNVQPSAVLLDPEGWILKSSFLANNIPPSDYGLEQNYPNPFNSTTNIAYQLPTRGQVTLKIFDVLGHEIATIVNAKQSAGLYEYQWNPHSNASGIYFYQIRAGDFVDTRKMLFVK